SRPPGSQGLALAAHRPAARSTNLRDEEGRPRRRVWRQPPLLPAGCAVCIPRGSYAAWVWPPLRSQDTRPAGRRQGLSLHCAAARYARLRCVPRQPLPPPTQHQKNSRSYLLFSSSPCSLIKTTGGVSEMLGRRELDKHEAAVDRSSLRGEVAERLRQEVAQMNVNNFIVRPKRRLVEKYADAKAWETLGLDERNELVGDVAGLPSELVDEDLEAKQFDLLMLRLQLGLLRHERSFTRWSEDVRQIAGALEEKASIPMVRAELELIIEVQTDEFWQDITASMLEDVRKRLRSLVKFIEKTKRQNIYTDFADLIGEEREIDLPGFAAGHDVERFRDKTQQFLRAHESDP